MFGYFLANVFVFLLGLCIGSFLNVVVYRLERKERLTGRSFCPHCRHILNWKDLFPVLSFLYLKGHCRYCRQKISFQYPAVELATGIIFLLIFAIFGADILNLLFLFYIASSLIIIFIYDFKYYLIPDKVLLPAIVIAAVYRLVLNFDLVINYSLAIFTAAGFFLLIFLISKGKWMGFGDVKLAILMGLALGLDRVLLALFLAFFLGAAIGLALMFLKKKSLKSEIPFGPFLIAGTFVALLWGEKIINWYLRIFNV